ncbi:unnamed protein product, partial [Amoebophrya sp. A120]
KLVTRELQEKELQRKHQFLLSQVLIYYHTPLAVKKYGRNLYGVKIVPIYPVKNKSLSTTSGTTTRTKRTSGTSDGGGEILRNTKIFDKSGEVVKDQHDPRLLPAPAVAVPENNSDEHLSQPNVVEGGAFLRTSLPAPSLNDTSYTEELRAHIRAAMSPGAATTTPQENAQQFSSGGHSAEDHDVRPGAHDALVPKMNQTKDQEGNAELQPQLPVPVDEVADGAADGPTVMSRGPLVVPASSGRTAAPVNEITSSAARNKITNSSGPRTTPSTTVRNKRSSTWIRT